jgi:hypothetical protein
MQLVGIAWYRSDQWQRLRELSVDTETLEQTHQEWLTMATKTLDDLQKAGLRVQKVDVDVEELVRWCQERELPVDAKARARFVTETLEQQYTAADKSRQ